ncbi:MFS transporter [Streptomyces sp. N2-109]|uniref:MFS transporter n=1 Tax=Streptomyces gossypii TaxID=2883101 RepID=A0ABT2JYH9_9ACTN|nr:MFS transporter [Streptomyces gossypii]MCT2592940.1 MFS transporter [Streptomyces gossypii]MCT2593673.1 MFS transporter [Streptomyces gossypii]
MSSQVVSGRTRAGRREWIGLALLALPSMLLSLDVTLLHLAVPQLGAALAPSSTQMLWIIDIYAFMIAGFLVTMGTLGDRIGRRRLLLGGALAFGVASVLAAYANSPEMLIGARALLGIAGATLMPSTLALISNMFQDPRQRGSAFGIWAASFSLGIALGPVVGGAMLERFWWGSVFLLALPVMALLLITGPLVLPEYRDENAGRLDLISVGLSLATILPVVYGIKETAKHGPGAASLAALLVGAAFGILFGRRQLRLTEPMLDLSLFRSRAFSVALGVMLFGAFAIGGIYLFVTQYLQLVAGLSPLRAGLWLLPAAALLIVMSMLAPVAARRIRPGSVTGIGLALSAVGYLILTLADPSDNGLAYVVIGFSFVYTGIGPLMALSVSLIVGSAPDEKAGAASALQETSSEFGLALGIAALGSIGTTVYRDGVSDSLPADTPAAAETATQDTLARALDATEGLPASLANQILTPAREAFATGLNVVALISAILVAALAVLAFTTLRHVPPTGAAQEPEEREAPEALAESAPDTTASVPVPR